MTDGPRDPRGINFIRYLVPAVFLLGFTSSYVTDLFRPTSSALRSSSPSSRMLIAISESSSTRPDRGSLRDRGRPPLGRGGPVVAGRRVSLGFLVDSTGSAIWLPHFLAAFFAWGLREIFHLPDPLNELLRLAPLSVPPPRCPKPQRIPKTEVDT